MVILSYTYGVQYPECIPTPSQSLSSCINLIFSFSYTQRIGISPAQRVPTTTVGSLQERSYRSKWCCRQTSNLIKLDGGSREGTGNVLASHLKTKIPVCRNGFASLRAFGPALRSPSVRPKRESDEAGFTYHAHALSYKWLLARRSVAIGSLDDRRSDVVVISNMSWHSS
jgi:hypothetical protein